MSSAMIAPPPNPKTFSFAFNERECKLDADYKADLKSVADHILHDPHYIIDKEAPASDERVRTYWDNEYLNAFDQGVEIRTEPKGNVQQKMTVKIDLRKIDPGLVGHLKKALGKPTDDVDLFDRLEKGVRIAMPRPDLTALPEEYQALLRAVLGVEDLAVFGRNLLALSRLTTHRTRIEYHPLENPETSIEYAHDIGKGINCLGNGWKIRQIELEKKTGDDDVILEERDRLRASFNSLTVNSYSKPTPGFNWLKPLLAHEEGRRYVREKLGGGEFKILAPPARLLNLIAA